MDSSESVKRLNCVHVFRENLQMVTSSFYFPLINLFDFPLNNYDLVYLIQNGDITKNLTIWQFSS